MRTGTGTVRPVTAVLAPIRWLRAHPTAADAALGVMIAAFAVPGLWFVPEEIDVTFREPDALAVVLVLLGTLPLAIRRSRPLLCLGIVGVASVAISVLGYPDFNTGGIGVIVGLYSVAAHASRRDSVVAAGATAVAVTVVVLSSPIDVSLGAFVANYLVFGTAWILGDNLRTRRAYVAELEERADRLERSRLEEARAAAASERTRIARELHDVVAHNMSVMVIQAGAARRVLGRDPDGAAEALSSIEQVGRQALADMRRSLGVLREGDDEGYGTTPQPTVADLERLVAQTAEAGLAVELEVEGSPRPLPPGVGLSAYRIVQEALTNALRHAGPASATVHLRYAQDSIELEVRDDGRGAAVALTSGVARGGHGLVGMRERVQLFGGELKVGDRPGGGYGVWARIPVPAAT